jgi:nitroreductase
METWDAIRARRNVRAYEDRPIPPADLDRILEAAWRAPSAGNRQHWDFVVTTDKAQLEKMGEVWQGARHLPGAAAGIMLVANQEEDERGGVINQYDLGQATYAIMVAAADLGIGSGHSSVGDQDLARGIFGIPEGHIPAYMIGLGYPADRPLKPIVKPNRRPIDEVIHRGHW